MRRQDVASTWIATINAVVLNRSIHVIGVMMAFAFGCERSPSADAAARSDPQAGAARIVSLAPAITSTVALLGAEGLIVGRTPWCHAIDPGVAVAWDGTSVDAERLIAQRPSHVFFQSTVSGGPRDEVTRLAAGRGWTVRSWRLDRLDDVRRMIAELGDVLGGERAAAAKGLLERFDRACSVDPNVSALGPTVLLFGVDPPTAFGPGSYVDDVWSAIGGVNAVKRGAYPELSVEELASLDPEWVVVVGSEAQRRAVERLPVRAIRDGRIIHASDPGLLEPGASAVAAIESLRAAIAMALDAPAPRDDPAPHRESAGDEAPAPRGAATGEKP